MANESYVLLVEDKPRQITQLKSLLTDAFPDLDIKVCRTLNKAYSLIEQGAPLFVTIDLYTPVEFEQLPTPDGYRDNGFNQGQKLGMYLIDKGVDFLYLTGHAGFHRGPLPPGIEMFEKHQQQEAFDLMKQKIRHAIASAGRQAAADADTGEA